MSLLFCCVYFFVVSFASFRFVLFGCFNFDFQHAHKQRECCLQHTTITIIKHRQWRAAVNQRARNPLNCNEPEYVHAHEISRRLFFFRVFAVPFKLRLFCFGCNSVRFFFVSYTKPSISQQFSPSIDLYFPICTQYIFLCLKLSRMAFALFHALSLHPIFNIDFIV